MANDLEKKASEAFMDEDFEQAVELYTQAIRDDPKNATLFVKRAQANIKLENFTDAVADANMAIELDASMPKAFFLKGVACFSLEEYQTAKAAFSAGSSFDANNPKFKEWIEKCDARLVEEAAADGKEKQPGSALPVNGPSTTPLPSSDVTPTKSDQQQGEGPVQMVSEDNLEGPPLQSTKPKYRHEYYQKPNEVVVTVFAKGLSGDCVHIEFGEQFLSVVIQVPGEDKYVLQKRLFSKIIPEQCKYAILATKIEIRLAKALHTYHI